MKTLTLDPGSKAVLDWCANIAAAIPSFLNQFQTQGAASPPAIMNLPGAPADPRQAAFYNAVVVPLYNKTVTFIQVLQSYWNALPVGAPAMTPTTTGLVLTPTGFVPSSAPATTPFTPGSAADSQYQALIASGYTPADAYGIALNQAALLSAGPSP